MDSLEGTKQVYSLEGTKQVYTMEGIKEGYSMDETKAGFRIEGNNMVGSTEGTTHEKVQVNFIATLVEKVMKDYREDLEPKLRVKCNFYNRGFCRQGSSCEYEHPVNVCEQYLKEGECLKRHCNGRHIYKCRYFQSPQGCFRGNSCEFLHDNQGIVPPNVEDDHALSNHNMESVQVTTKITNTETSTVNLETIGEDSTSEEENDDKPDQEILPKEVKEHEMGEDEVDGYTMLEKAIDAGMELDNDLLDKILEGMNKDEVAKDSEEVKKKKTKKVRKKASFSFGKMCEN